jgi:hypothetical protein
LKRRERRHDEEGNGIHAAFLLRNFGGGRRMLRSDWLVGRDTHVFRDHPRIILDAFQGGAAMSTQTVDFRFDGLKAKWADLKRVLSGDNECFQTAEWQALEAELNAKVGEIIETATALPKAIPDDFPGDPQTVRRAEIVKSFLNKRLWQVSILAANGRRGDLAQLWVSPKTTVRVGWKIYVKPSPNASESGWVLQGQYNKFGDRLS